MPEWRNGRRTRLKIWRPHGHMGSSPFSGTIPDAIASLRRGARVDDWARLESACTPKGCRGFESLPLRHPPPPVAALAERRGCSFRVQGSGKTQKPVNAKVANAAKDSQTLKPKKQFRSVAALAERRGCSVPLRTHAPAGASTIPLATPSVPSLNPSPPSLPAPCVKWLFGFP